MAGPLSSPLPLAGEGPGVRAEMTLTELRYVVALARERHFGRAAAGCHVSQPTLSVAIRKLEEELGLKLFERRASHVALTDIGERIVGTL